MLKSLQTVIVFDNKENDGERVYDKKSLKELEQQLKEIQQNFKAANFAISLIYRRTFQSFSRNVVITKKQRAVERYFNIWKEQTLIKKVEKCRKRKLFSRLRDNIARKMQKNISAIKWITAQNCNQRCLKTKIFSEWKIITKIEKKYNQLTRTIKRKYLSLFMLNCKVKNSDKLSYEIVNNIHNSKKLRDSFQNWVLSTKITKVQGLLMKKYSKIVIKRFVKNCDFQKSYYKKIYEKKLINHSFFKLNTNRLNNKCDRHYQKQLLRKYLGYWLKAGSILFQEKQQDLKNQQIVSAFLERKQETLMRYCFQVWKNTAQEKAFQRKKIKLTKQFYQKKQISYLYRKYFDAMKELKYVNIADRFRAKNLKMKVFTGLQDYMIKHADLWEKVYKFTQKRQKRKYFQAIKKFGDKDKQKILKFRTAQMWNKFCFGIVKIYTQMNHKAQIYYQQSLKFKTIFGLKTIISLKNKTNRAIIYIHANLNLRRWVKNFRIRQFVRDRKYVLMGKIFRQLKLMRINKKWSKQKNAEKLHEMSQINYMSDASLVFTKLSIESPSKLKSLEYSISAYNSNNMDGNF